MNAMKAIPLFLSVMITALILINPCKAQPTTDASLAFDALRSLTFAGRTNAVSLAFGVAGNIEMIAIGGFPLEYDDGHSPEVNVSHAILCTGRLTFSIFPPISVSRARKVLQPWRESPETAPSCRKLFSYMDAAQVLTAVAPVLSIAGGIMMFTSAAKVTEYTYYDNNTFIYEKRMKNPTLKTIGWICVGAGLAATISGSIMIGLSKKELAHKMGTFNMSASPAGVGVKYTLPTRN
jgi:hypothetical protein